MTGRRWRWRGRPRCRKMRLITRCCSAVWRRRCGDNGCNGPPAGRFAMYNSAYDFENERFLVHCASGGPDGGLSAQTPAPRPAPPRRRRNRPSGFRSTSSRRDVIVRDDKGNFIADLKKDEFEIYEDGVKQDISSMTVSHGGRVTNVLAPPPPPPPEGIILPPTRPRERRRRAASSCSSSTICICSSRTPAACAICSRRSRRS